MVISALMMAAALVTGDPDGVVATAPATNVDLTAVIRPVAPSAEHAAQQAVEPHNLTTDQQIDRWLESRDPDAVPYSGQRAERPVDDRKMHSEFTAGIGTGGYTDFGMAVSLPIGENGRLGLSYRRTENGLYGYGYGDYGLGRNPYYNDMGYSFPGRPDPNKALDYEYRMARPDGAPNAWRSPYRGERAED